MVSVLLLISVTDLVTGDRGAGDLGSRSTPPSLSQV